MAHCLYFATINGDPVQLADVNYAERDSRYQNAWDKAEPSETGRIVRDCNLRAIGRTPDGRIVEADRLIFRKSNPSNHKCGARCRHAKGGECECACGGKFHGHGNN